MSERDSFEAYRRFFALEPDVLVLSAAMFAFSLGFQMTFRYLAEYLTVLGASAAVVGLYKSFSDLVGAVYPYAGGVVSDVVGSRRALTAFGLLSVLGFGVWAVAPELAGLTIGPVGVPAWTWVFVGFVFAQAWKSFGLGATFAVVKQSVDPDQLATGFASTEVFRRVGFLVGPAVAAAILAVVAPFSVGFQYVILVAAAFGILATVVQHVLYDASQDTFGSSFAGVSSVREDLRSLPDPLRPLLVGDAFVRFGNGMVYALFVLVVADLRTVGFQAFGIALDPAPYFGILLSVEMVVALLVMWPASKLARRVGLVPVVASGFLVYALFPVALILAPADQWVYALLFAASGLRFAGLPAHKALIVGPAERDTGGRVTGSYYLVRNTLVIPAGVLGGWLYGRDPVLAFSLASVIAGVGVLYFLVFGEEFAAYA
ncbi:MAG: MFS transporter [Halobacteriaceae archaeon]